MSQGNNISDPKLTQHVTQSVANSDVGAPARVTTPSVDGQVTLSESIQYEHRWHSDVRAAHGVEGGVRRAVKPSKVMATPPGN